MAKFLTTHATAYFIEEIIQGANERLLLITPYLKISKTLLERLKDASRRGVSITIVYGKDQLRTEERKKLAEIDGLTLRFMENLHAKCYLNESASVIGSMNMYEFSEKTNREMSVLLSREEDHDAYTAAVAEVESILAASEEKQLRRMSSVPALAAGTESRTRPHREKSACCIRCGEAKHYSPSTPLCYPCYSEWSMWSNEDYTERYCHRCGESRSTTKRRPLCSDCYPESF